MNRVKRIGLHQAARGLMLVASLLLLPGSAAADFSFQGIGVFPDPVFSSTSVSGISGDGTWLTGQAQVGLGSGTLRLLRWSQATGLEGLGPATGSGISNDGSVIVGRGSGGSAGSGALRWTEATGLVDLGTLGSPGVTQAEAVSADGSVVVGISAGSEAFKWTESTGMVALPGGFGFAHGISADGSIVVGRSGGSPVLWDGDSDPIDLGGIPGATFGEALGVSADGTKVVGLSSAAVFESEAFLWTQEAGFLGLGFTSAEDTESRALDVSADGRVVVGDVRSSVSQAMIWDPDHGMRVLQQVLAAELDLTGWELWSATGISDDGRTIVGNGRAPDGTQQGWIAVIPEPSSALLIGLGMAGLAWRPRR